MPSIFSRIVSGELPAFKVAEDGRHLAFLDITPLVEGHVLVIPKQEVDYIFDLPADELASLHVFAQRVAKALKAAVSCKRVGVAVIGLEVPHAHIHLIPMQTVQDINFTNPKIKVPEARMQELATAIAAKVEGGSGLSEPKTAAKTGADASAPVPAELQKQVAGLHFLSESDAPLEAVAYTAPGGELSNAALLKLLGEPADAKVATVELTQFLRNHTADDGVLDDVALANRYKALQMFMKQDMDGVQVYRVGTGPQIHVYALGRTMDGTLAGFKTVLTET